MEQYLINKKRHKRCILFWQCFLFVSFLIIWEISARFGWINAFIFSSPSELVLCFFTLLKKGHLMMHIGTTLFETLLSFLLVLSISLFFAILLWWNHSISEVSEPYLVILNSLPKSAMAPIFIVWLGNNMKTVVVTAISVAIFGSVLNLYTSFSSTDPDKIKLIQTLHGTKLQCLTKVILPINLPSILSILKVDIGLCLIGVVIGEFLAARQGLGYLIIYSSQVFKMNQVIVSIMILCLIAILLYRCITFFEKKLAQTSV